MPLQTFVAGIVVALALGAALASLWSRTRIAARAAEDAARAAADSTRPIAETLARIESQIRDVESQRPDMIVKLPGGRSLAVDAKVPLAAYLDAEASTDAAAREAALARHAQQVTRHVAQLSAREYWVQFQPAPEMVVLFLAGDHFLAAALERDPELLERALARKVLIATPMTLISVLKGVGYGWRQEKLARNAEELRRIGAEFYDRLRAFAEVYADSGRHLAKAVDSYNRSAGSWDARVLPSLRRMSELGVGGAGEPPQILPVDSAVREPQAVFRRPEG
jgi:DNA recombination protein RmuC